MNETPQNNEDIIDDTDFSYDGFQVVRGEFFAHIFEPSFTLNNFYDEQPPLPQKANPQIKQMPIYDRDAELSSLTLTINAWNSSMERFLRISKLCLASEEAKEKLNSSLVKLCNTASLIQLKIKESDNEQ